MNETESDCSLWADDAVTRSGVAPRLRLRWQRALVAPGIELAASISDWQGNSVTRH